MKKGQGWARCVTLDNLPDFATWLRQADDAQTEAARKERKQKKVAARGQPSPFLGVPLALASRFGFKRSGKQGGSAQKGVQHTGERRSAERIASRGDFLWRRTLSRSDAQKTAGRTNPTGCLRFVKARRLNPKRIDQRTFFRNEVFGRFRWNVVETDPYEEATVVPFHVTLNGKPLGVFELQIRHKPSRESGQNNYTTSLHWGELMSVVREKVNAGQLFSLFAPSAGKQKPFYIEIS